MSKGKQNSIDLAVIAKSTLCAIIYITKAISKTFESFLFTKLEHPKISNLY